MYVKMHRVTKLKYLGVTTHDDPHVYPGKGTYWTQHLKKHGRDVKTIVIFQTKNHDAIKRIGRMLSIQWNVVESDDWANLILETGYDWEATEQWIEDARQRAIERWKDPKARKKVSDGMKRWYEENPGKHSRLGVKLPQSQIDQQRTKLIGTSWGNHGPAAKAAISAAQMGREKTEDEVDRIKWTQRNASILWSPEFVDLILALNDDLGWSYHRINRVLQVFDPTFTNGPIRRILKIAKTDRNDLFREISPVGSHRRNFDKSFDRAVSLEI